MTASEDELAQLDAVAQAELVHRGDVQPVELVEAAIERIQALNPVLNAVVTPMFDQAIDAARSVPRGPYAGVPYLLKDLALEVEGVRFCEGSMFLRDNVSHYTSELVARLQRAGLVVLGKTNTPEFGMVPACEPVLFGATRNPWDPQRSTSGSSGGSAAAVAAGMTPMAHARRHGWLDPLPRVSVRFVRLEAHAGPHAARSRVRRRCQRLGLRARGHPVGA